MTKIAAENILKGLNERQKEAVRYLNGPLLVLAGAGSGKTKVLAHRVANIISSGIPPERILAITFTNKAAEEMAKRVGLLLGEDWKDKKPLVSTFHALGAMMLRESGGALGIGKKFSIFDEEDTLALIKECLKELSLDPKQFQPAKMRAVISSHKNELRGVEDVEAEAGNSPFLAKLCLVWAAYEKKLRAHNALDFDDLILKTLTLLNQNLNILQKYRERWQYIHIDEYQDTNRCQYLLANMLAESHQNICAVGDIDQSIYGWRGADFRNILNFEKDWPEAKIITLEENYRSTQNILDAANCVIVKNQYRRPKNLFTQKNGGAKIKVLMAANELEEADFVARQAKRLVENGVPEDRMAVLYRTNFQSRVLEEAFIRHGLPYQLIGVKFYERKEIKDVLSYLRAAVNPQDLMSVKRIINTPPRGIGKTLCTKYFALNNHLTAKEKSALENFENIIRNIKDAAERKTAAETIRFIIEKTGYGEFLSDGTEEENMRFANVQELVSLAQKYDHMSPSAGIEKLLADAALMSGEETLHADKAVKLMTVHAAKGLEFQAVFVTGLEEGLFPHTIMGASHDPLRSEEERRLFYVALTRAERDLFLSYAVFRTIFGGRQVSRPSRFLDDIPGELTEPINREDFFEIPPEDGIETINL